MTWPIDPAAINGHASGTSAAMTLTADTEVIGAPAPSSRLYITDLVISNSHASVDTIVDIKDGTTTILSFSTKAASKSEPYHFEKPLVLSDGAALQAANVTTGSSVIVSANGYVAD